MSHEVPVSERATGRPAEAQQIGVEDAVRLPQCGEHAGHGAGREAEHDWTAEPGARELAGGPEEQQARPGDAERAGGEPAVGRERRREGREAEVPEEQEVETVPGPLSSSRKHEERHQERRGVEYHLLGKEEPVELERAERYHDKHDAERPEDENGGGEALGAAGGQGQAPGTRWRDGGIVLWPGAGGN